MKQVFITVLTVFISIISFCQSPAIQGDSCGHQKKYRFPINQWHTGPKDSTWGLVYLPKSYKDSINKRYPLFIFFHGLGQQATIWPSTGSQLCNLNQDGLPGMIANGLVPQATSGGKNYEFIVVSLQMPGSPGQNEIYYSLPYIESLFRIDTNRLYGGGLSQGGYGVLDLMLDTLHGNFINKFSAIVPQSAVQIEPFKYKNLIRAKQDTLATLFICGSLDGFNITMQAYMDSINLSGPFIPSIYISRPNLAHVPAAWDSIYSLTYRPIEIFNMNGWEWLLHYSKVPQNPTTTTTITTTTTTTNCPTKPHPNVISESITVDSTGRIHGNYTMDDGYIQTVP